MPGLAVSQHKAIMPDTAMVFAAGFGTRMRPLTETVPKPLIEVAGKPMMDYRLEKLVEAGIKQVVINTHYLAEQIQAYASKRRDIDVIISHEAEILETGGALLKAKNHFAKAPIFIINSDIIWLDKGTPLLERLAAAWNPDAMDMLMCLHPTERAIGYHGAGDFALDEQGVIRRPDTPQKPYVYAGIQLFSPTILERYGDAHYFSLSAVFKDALTPGHALYERMHGLIHTGDWLHIDSLGALEEAEAFLSKA